MEENKTLPKIEPHPLRTTGEVILLLENLIYEVKNGQIDIKRANCIGFLSNLMLKAIEQEKIASKIKMLERLFE